MDRQQKYERWLVAFVMLVLFLPLLQLVFGFFEAEEHEVEFGVEAPDFNLSNWFSGDFQRDKEQHLKHTVPFRMELVRLNNQLYYSLFNQGRSNSVVVGKQDELLLEKQIVSLQGQDYIGVDSISAQIEKLKYVEEKLAQRGIKLVVAIVPSKATYHSDLIPDWIKIAQKGRTNYSEYVEQLKVNDMAYFDAVPWLLEHKHQTTDRLFPKNGLHYTKYGQFILMDSLTRFLAHETSMPFPRMKLSSMQDASHLSDEEEDLENYLRLFTKIPDEPLRTPIFDVSSDGQTPKVLTIGDSYFMGMCNSNYCTTVFNGGQFWYYNREVRTQPGKIDGYVNQINVLEEVEKNDVVLIYISDANCYRFSFGFVDELYELYTNRREHRIKFYTKQIESDPEWLELVREKSISKGITLTEAIRIDAEYLYEMELKNGD